MKMETKMVVAILIAFGISLVVAYFLIGEGK